MGNHAPMTENEISFSIRSAIFQCFNEFGPGLLESVYEAALSYYLTKAGLKIERQKPLPVWVDSEKLDVGYRIDLLVEDKVIIEVKSVEFLSKVHHMQLLTYLRMSNLKFGILVNFNTDSINNSIYRKVNNL